MTTFTMFRRITALALFACTSGACFGPIQVSGGPQRQTHFLPQENLADNLRPLVADEPAAVARLEKVERDRRISTVLLWSGMGALGGCLLLSSQTVSQKQVPGSTYSLIFGTCGLAIALEVASIIYAPTHGDYGEALEAYNARRPATPWSAPRLGVEAPLPPPPPLPAPLPAPALTSAAPPAW